MYTNLVNNFAFLIPLFCTSRVLSLQENTSVSLIQTCTGFYMAKPSLQGYIFFLTFALKYRTRVLVKPASMSTEIDVVGKNKKNITIFPLKISFLQILMIAPYCIGMFA